MLDPPLHMQIPKNKMFEDICKSMANVSVKLYFASHIMEVHLQTQGKGMYLITLFSCKLRIFFLWNAVG